MIQIANHWKDYELLDSGDGEKLERWGKFILRRPDPQIIWPRQGSNSLWESVDAHYHRSSGGGGNWEYNTKLPERWTISYGPLSFYIQPTNFKHTGLFPEQAVNWDWMMNAIRTANRPIRVLNLFAYTGGATVAAAHAGADVCHVDAAKGMVQWAKENIALSKLENRSVRFIVDDVKKFVQREERRGNTYDAIIMDPPSYGRGPKGEIWKIEDELYALVDLCKKVLSKKPLFFLINSYTTGFSPVVVQNILQTTVKKKFGGSVTSDEVGLSSKHSNMVLPCGIYGRWNL